MGALYRAAPVPSGALPFSTRSRGAAPAARGATARDPSSTGRVAGANQKLSFAPIPKYTKAVRNGAVIEMEVTPASGGEMLPGASTPPLKPAVRGATARAASTQRARAEQKFSAPGLKCVKIIATCGPMAREKPARRAGADEQFPVPGPKRAKVTPRDGDDVSAVEPALGTLRKRMTAELGALRDLLRKVELLCSGKNAVGDVERRSAPKAVSVTGALYKAKTRRQLLEMESAVVPDESIHERDLRRLCITEYGRPGIMRQLGLFLKADA
ncbi:unnamed protein product [Urochloa humidicola]